MKARYISPLDGYLVSLNAETGEVIGVSTPSLTAPALIRLPVHPALNGRVFIGNGGGEFGVRGYVAHDTKTGDRDWRFFTVPGDPSKPFEHPEMEAALSTRSA